MKTVFRTEHSDIATVYIGDMGDNRYVEFVESLQPPFSRDEKWVLIISTLFGCPVGCRMCDAGRFFKGKLTVEEMFAQIDYPVVSRFPGREIPVEKFKIQFARMGEPVLNFAVIQVLQEFPERYNATGFIPSISTIAPAGRDPFFEELLGVKRSLYGDGKFQMQFSIHSTSEKERDLLMPVKKWDLQRISEFGERFYTEGDRKITLNFIYSGELEMDEQVLAGIFDPTKFLVKITPVNPTVSAEENGLNTGYRTLKEKMEEKAGFVKEAGFDTILSVGELEENRIGSNCGQYIGRFMNGNRGEVPADSYTYGLRKIQDSL